MITAPRDGRLAQLFSYPLLSP